jgi:hypothetical protein
MKIITPDAGQRFDDTGSMWVGVSSRLESSMEVTNSLVEATLKNSQKRDCTQPEHLYKLDLS